MAGVLLRIDDRTNIAQASFLGFIELRVPYATQLRQRIGRIMAGGGSVSYAAWLCVAPAYRGNCGTYPRWIAKPELGMLSSWQRSIDD